VLAPLTIEDSVLDEGLDTMEEALAEAVAGSRQPH
jgi:4-aminobutyrate aminotransferase-like enzyme